MLWFGIKGTDSHKKVGEQELIFKFSVLKNRKLVCQKFMHNPQLYHVSHDKTINISELTIEKHDFTFINRFKKTNKAAFYYWQMFVEMSES